MKDTLRPGASKVARIEVDRDRTIGFMGEEGRVYGTPYLVRDIEMTCRELILEHADPGEDSVGTEVAVRHLAPTLPGMTVEITAKVAKLKLEPFSTPTARPVAPDTISRLALSMMRQSIWTSFSVFLTANPPIMGILGPPPP